MPRTPAGFRSSRELLEEQLASRRQALRASAAQATVTDAELRQLAQSRPDAKAEGSRPGAPAPIAAKLPAAVRVLDAEKTPRVRLHHGDKDKWRRRVSDFKELEIRKAAYAAIAEKRPTGERVPLPSNLKGLVNVLLRLGRYTVGKIQAPFKFLAAELGSCVDVVFRGVNFLEEIGVLDIESPRVWGKDKHGNTGLFRDANIYILRLPEPQDDEPAVDEAGRLARYAARVRRATEWFALQIRATGFLNTSAESVRAPLSPA